MEYQEKKGIVNILSGLVITTIYGWLIYQRHLQGQFDLNTDFKAWGVIFLIFIGVSIVSRIIIYIIFHILNSIATRDEEIPVSDERDELIKLKSERNSHYAFTLSFILAFVLLAFGKSVYWVFIMFVISGLFSEMVENVSHIYYHRKGI